MRYKVTVTIDGITAAASKLCRTMREAEQAKAGILKALQIPVEIDIETIGGNRGEKAANKAPGSAGTPQIPHKTGNPGKSIQERETAAKTKQTAN